MIVIGVTGPSGAGKSFFCSLFEKFGLAALGCDEIYHELTSLPSPCTLELANEFGSNILLPSGGIDRRALADIVFADKEKLARLNSITHKYVLNEVRERIARLPASCRGALVDAPLLFESGFDVECDLTIALLAKRSARLDRLEERDRLSREKLEARLNAAKSDEWYSEKCNVTVYNNADPDALKNEVAKICEQIGLK